MRIPTREEQARYTGVNAHDTQRFNVQERTPNMQLQVNADMFGGGQARAIGQSAQELQKGARQIAHWYRENELTKATEAFTKYKESLNDELYGENGIFTSKGESALEAPKRANELLKKRAAEFSRQAGSSLGQDFFMQKVSRFNQQLMPGATMHAETERKNWMYATHSAAQESSKNDAVKNYNNPEVFNQHMGAVAMHATLAAQIQGLPPEAVKLKRDEAVSSGYMQVGQSLLAAGDVSGAMGILESGRLVGQDGMRFQASIRQEEKRMQAEARANEDRAKETQANSRYTEFYEEIKNLPLDERVAAGMEGLEKIEDPKVKTRMLGRFRQDIGMETTRQNAQASVQVRQFKDAAHKQGWLPSQALTVLEQTDDMLPQARERLRKELAGEERKPTKENIARSNDILRLIDKQEVVDDRGIDAFAWDNGLTDIQTEKARKYLSEGGNKSQVSISRVEQLYKKMNKGKKAPEGLFDAVRENLEPGKAVTEEHLRKTIANLYMDGETDGSGWFSDKETYATSLQEGRGDKWLPHVSDAEKKEISTILREQGVRVTDERIRQYKKRHVMGIDKEAKQ